MNKIIVLMATYNGEKYIQDQILSIFNQEQCHITLLISDDGSTDNTLKIINKLKSKFKRIKLLSRKNKRVGFSDNFYSLFIKCNLANYDYVAISDQDDIFCRNKLSTQIKYLKKYNYAASSSSVRCFGSSDSLLSQSSNITKYDFLFEGAGQGCTFIIDRKNFIEFQHFLKLNIDLVKNFYFHDWLIYLFIRSSNSKWLFIKQPLVYYRIHKNNQVGNKYTLGGISLRLKKLFGGWYFDQIITASKIATLIDPSIPNIENIGFMRFSIIVLFYGRRKISDRIFSFLGLLTSYFRLYIK